jgi:hypothetical protein
MELKINEQGLLFKTNNQIDNHMMQCLEQLKIYSPHELRVIQQNIYHNFIQAKTGEDITKNFSQDPFVDVAGFPLKTFTIERFREYPRSRIVTSATTDFAPMRYIRTTTPIPKTNTNNYERYYKDFKLNKKEKAKSTFRFPQGPLVLKDSPWKFYYAANDHTLTGKGKADIYFIYGLIFLDDEPVRLLREMPEFESLYKLMVIVANEFSHDFTGHGSLDLIINDTPEATIYCTEVDNDSEMCARTLSQLRRHYLSGSSVASFFDEIRQLNLHMHLIGSCIKRNENYLTEIVQNAHTFFDVLKTATGKITGHYGEQVYTYFSQVYLFCLARMVPATQMHLVIRPSELTMFSDFLSYNKKEGMLNLFSSISSGLPVLKQGFGRNVTSFGIHDISHYIDQRTVFASAFNLIRISK